jgi:hypothetical protein
VESDSYRTDVMVRAVFKVAKAKVAPGVQLNTSRFRSCVSAAVRSEFPVVAEISP